MLVNRYKTLLSTLLKEYQVVTYYTHILNEFDSPNLIKHSFDPSEFNQELLLDLYKDDINVSNQLLDELFLFYTNQSSPDFFKKIIDSTLL